jgi:hypothetical protein
VPANGRLHQLSATLHEWGKPTPADEDEASGVLPETTQRRLMLDVRQPGVLQLVFRDQSLGDEVDDMAGTNPLDAPLLYSSLRETAQAELTEHLRRLSDERRSLRVADDAVEEFTRAAFLRVLARDEEYGTAIGPLLENAAGRLSTLARTEVSTRGVPDNIAGDLVGGSTVRDITADIHLVVPGEDNNLQVFTPPFADAWTSLLESQPHKQAEVHADKSSGDFGAVYTIEKEGGSIFCGAGVMVLFMRSHPGSPPGQGPRGWAQVRTYTPFNYRWQDVSYLGPAHQHGGFGVLVWSVPLDGGPSRIDQDHHPTSWLWDDGTSWFQSHSNNSFPDYDDDMALIVNDQPPYFPIEPARLYGAWIWCLLEGDAHGEDFTSAGYAQAQIDATTNLIFVAQQ